MSAAELDLLVEEIIRRRSMLSFLAVNRLKIGQRVQFAGRRKRMVTGTIEQFKRGGKLLVGGCSDGQKWRLPAYMVTPIS
jgi:hypothetical protein